MLWASRKASVLNHLQQAWAKMNSLYAQYLTERTDDKIIEQEEGYVTYRYLSAQEVYIIDIFVLPKLRKNGIATNLADAVCKIAKNKGCKELIGTINPSAKGANESILTLIAYGMTMNSCADNIIVFKKEI